MVAGGSPTQDFRNRLGPAAVGQAFPLASVESDAKRYLVGVALHILPTRALSLEVDGLYRPLRFVQATVLANGERRSVSPATVVTWEFPILAKYRFASFGGVRPVVMGGPSLRLAGNLNGASPGKFGLTAGAGVEVRVGPLVVTPAARYTRWSGDSGPYRTADTRKDQVEFLVEVHSAKSAVLSSRLSLGLAVGATLSRDLNPPQFPNLTGARAAVFGPVLSFQISPRWELEGSAIQHPLGVGSHRLYTTWEVPALARYRWKTSGNSPVLGGGIAYRLPQAINGSRLRSLGFVVDGGYELRLWRVKATPRLRYTRWLEEQGDRRTGVGVDQVMALVSLRI